MEQEKKHGLTLYGHVGMGIRGIKGIFELGLRNACQTMNPIMSKIRRLKILPKLGSFLKLLTKHALKVKACLDGA